jgi:molybdate transport system substrate-binding protein
MPISKRRTDLHLRVTLRGGSASGPARPRRPLPICLSEHIGIRMPAFFFAFLLGLLPPAAHAQLVFAAASLKNALDEVAATSPSRPTISYGASSALARQIESGAPAALFISADLDWMDYLDRRKLVQNATRRNLLGNKLVLIAPAGSTGAVRIEKGLGLAALLGGGRLAIGDPAHVPAGKYAKEALEKLGAWDSVATRLAPSENVRVALALVARGETPYGIVYATDAASEPKVRVAGRFPDGLHAPIVYPAALTSAAKGPEAAAFLQLLAAPAARHVFEKHGFTPLH